METSAQVYEVELKFRVADLAALESRLAVIGAVLQPPLPVPYPWSVLPERRLSV